MPTNQKRYHPQWRDRIRPAALKRANYRCQECSVPNHSAVIFDDKGMWLEADAHIQRWAAREGKRVWKVVLTVAHVNQIVTDNREENLRVLCQKHHLQLDAPFKAFMRKMQSVWNVDRLINASTEAHGHSILPHMFAVSRAKLREYETVNAIAKKRNSRSKKNEYDRQIVDRCEALHREYARITQRICQMLINSYGIADPIEFFRSYCIAESRLIGAPAVNHESTLKTP